MIQIMLEKYVTRVESKSPNWPIRVMDLEKPWAPIPVVSTQLDVEQRSAAIYSEDQMVPAL